jgi:hypothetical protein
MTIVPNVFILAAMGRWVYGLVVSAVFAAGCAAAAPSTDVSQNSTGDPVDLAGGVVVSNCMDGGSCSTGNPGDCSMGHAVCSGDVQSCVPDVTTQRCYDGPPGTVNKGVCKPGTQTCIGSLGTCDGEVKPAAQEDCFNDLDDDCDGVVNNGCPNTLTLGTPRALTLRGSATGGSAFSLRCPAGQFVAKSVTYADDADVCLGGIDIYCATPTLVRGATAYSITETVSATALTAHATNINTGENATFDCGATGFVPAWYVDGESDASFTNALGSSCATTVLTLSATNQLTFTFTKQAGGGNYYGYLGLSGASKFEDTCNNGEVLIGWDGRKGNGMDATQAVCAPLQVVYK